MPKRKHTLLTIKEKNELLDKLEKGVPSGKFSGGVWRCETDHK